MESKEYAYIAVGDGDTGAAKRLIELLNEQYQTSEAHATGGSVHYILVKYPRRNGPPEPRPTEKHSMGIL